MTTISTILPLIWFCLVVLFFLSAFKGLSYDSARKAKEPSYKGDHSISYKHGKFYFSFPLYITTKHSDIKLRKLAQKYNLTSINFWLVAAFLATYYLAFS